MNKSSIYSSLISRELKDERNFLKLLPHDYLVNQLGVSTKTSLMDKYLANTLTASELTAVASIISEARYLVFANVNENYTSKTTSETASRSYENDEGETVVIPAEVNKIHSRSMTVTINIYDLENGQTVFTGSISKNTENKTTYEKSKHSHRNGLLGFVASVAETGIARSLPYPEAPSEITLIKDILKALERTCLMINIA